jgi:hypothetical protein
MGVTEEATEFPSLGNALDFFLGKVLRLMRYADREVGGARVPEIPGTAVAGERFPVIS